MSAERFEKEHKSGVGPGSYQIPSFVDHQASSTGTGLERSQLDPGLESSGGSFQVYDDAGERGPKAAPRTPRRRLFGTAKENRQPQVSHSAGSLFGGRGSNLIYEPAEGEPPKRSGRPAPFAEEKLRLQAEAKAGDLAMARKSVARLQAQLQAKDRQLEELQKRLEELSASQSEAWRRADGLEAEVLRGRKALHEKDQALAALHRSLQLSKAHLEDYSSRGPEERVRELQSLQELAVAQARRLTEKEAEMQEQALELEAARGLLQGLEERFAACSAAMEAKLRCLVEAQERIASGVAEKGLEAEREVEYLRGKLQESRDREARLLGRFVAGKASLKAALAQAGQEQLARLQAEGLAGSREPGALRGRAAEAEIRAGEEEETSLRLGRELAELCGRLFTAERALAYAQESRQELQEVEEVEEAALQEATAGEHTLEEATLGAAALGEGTIAEAALEESAPEGGAFPEAVMEKLALVDTVSEEAAPEEAILAAAVLIEDTLGRAAFEAPTLDEAAPEDAALSKAPLEELAPRDAALDGAALRNTLVKETTVGEAVLDEVLAPDEVTLEKVLLKEAALCESMSFEEVLFGMRANATRGEAFALGEAVLKEAIIRQAVLEEVALTEHAFVEDALKDGTRGEATLEDSGLEEAALGESTIGKAAEPAPEEAALAAAALGEGNRGRSALESPTLGEVAPEAAARRKTALEELALEEAACVGAVFGNITEEETTLRKAAFDEGLWPLQGDLLPEEECF